MLSFMKFDASWSALTVSALALPGCTELALSVLGNMANVGTIGVWIEGRSFEVWIYGFFFIIFALLIVPCAYIFRRLGVRQTVSYFYAILMIGFLPAFLTLVSGYQQSAKCCEYTCLEQCMREDFTHSLFGCFGIFLGFLLSGILFLLVSRFARKDNNPGKQSAEAPAS